MSNDLNKYWCPFLNKQCIEKDCMLFIYESHTGNDITPYSLGSCGLLEHIIQKKDDPLTIRYLNIVYIDEPAKKEG